jgi:hypothetical protein
LNLYLLDRQTVMMATVRKEKEKEKDTAEAQFAHILDDASKLYSDSSKSKLTDFLNPPISKVKDLISQIDKQNEQFSKFREKRQSIFSALAACLDPVETIGQIVSGAAAETFAPAEGIFGAVAYLIGAARDVSSAYDTIVELFELLKVSDIPHPQPRLGRDPSLLTRSP